VNSRIILIDHLTSDICRIPANVDVTYSSEYIELSRTLYIFLMLPYVRLKIDGFIYGLEEMVFSVEWNHCKPLFHRQNMKYHSCTNVTFTLLCMVKLGSLVYPGFERF
jgi:hypothetical protein